MHVAKGKPAAGRARSTALEPLAGFAVRFSGDDRAYAITKRAIDVVGAVAGLVLTLPITLAAAAAIRLETPGPVIFKQIRVGKCGVRFTMYKFRGMYIDARERFPELYDYSHIDTETGEFFFHQVDDPRVTRVGRFLRDTSIDELPNLINVLRGEMSLVGPRPEIPEMMPHYGDAIDEILSVKPGLSSPAKACGRDELSFQQTMQLDREYVRNRSLLLDLKVILWTIGTVLRRGGVR